MQNRSSSVHAVPSSPGKRHWIWSCGGYPPRLLSFPFLSFLSFTASALHTSTASPDQISKNQHLAHTDWPPPQYLKVPQTLALGWLVGDEIDFRICTLFLFFLVIIKESVPLASVLKLSSSLSLSLRVYAPLNDKHVYDEENYWSQYPSKQRGHASAHQLLTQLLYHYVLRGTHMWHHRALGSFTAH